MFAFCGKFLLDSSKVIAYHQPRIYKIRKSTANLRSKYNSSSDTRIGVYFSSTMANFRQKDSSTENNNGLGFLPRWNLERHFPYKSIMSEEIDQEIERIEGISVVFEKKYKSKLDSDLAVAIKEYEDICEKITELESYSYLVFCTNQNGQQIVTRHSSVEAKLSAIRASHLTFFELELASINDEILKKQCMESSSLMHYNSFIENVRKARPHRLSEEVEKALGVREAWCSAEPVVKYYEQQISNARFFLDGQEMNIENMLGKLFSSDPLKRRKALHALNKGLYDNFITRFAALSLNLVAGSWHIEIKERKYKNLRSRRNLSNNVSDEVVNALLEAVRKKGVELSKRYYSLKKSILKKFQGLQEFTWADRNAPLGLSSDDKVYKWDEAKDIVKSGYERFSPRMAKFFDDMIDEERIDMPAVDGKRSGAFCHGVTPKIGPFQMNNYTGNRRDVETLAHETGHGCQDLLAYSQGYLQYHPPLTLAETASIFGEMIVFRDLLSRSTEKKEQLAMLMGKIDSIINSVTRQCSFDRFEELIHNARQQGSVGDEMFDKFWIQATKEYYGEEGDVFDKYEDINHLWSYVTHFHCVPFYVYAYAFAELLVGSLFSVYEKEPEGFENKFLDLLAAGSTKDFVTVVKPFGLDPSKASFWTEALDYHLGGMLSETEKIAKELDFY